MDATHVVASVDVLGADGSVETITGTTIHPVWSVDRQEWVPLSELTEGEMLQGLDGLAVVLSVSLSRVSQPVYNIEVHGEHVYQVGELGLLVHNAYTGIAPGGGLVSRIKESGALVRGAEAAGRSAQKSIDKLTSELARSNLNPGIGTKPIGNWISEARARDGARVYFRQLADGTIEILGKSTKANQSSVIAEVLRLFGGS